MISYRLDATDLATSRFGVSPLSETTLSLRSVWRPEVYPHVQRWRDSIEPAVRRLDLEMLLALVAADYSTPDFLNPRPTGPSMDFDRELRAVGRLPDRIIERDIDRIHPHGRPPALTGRTSLVRERLTRAVDRYWRSCLRPGWHRMSEILTSDITHRGWSLAHHGTLDTVRGLSPSLSLTATELTGYNPSGPGYEASARGRGLVFIPTLFTPWMSYPYSPDEPPYVLYPARGRGRVTAPAPQPPTPLTDLFGAVRAALLLDLEEPASSTDLAARRGVSVSAINQQLRRLHVAGLLDDTRHGKAVLYRRSRRAEAIINALTD